MIPRSEIQRVRFKSLMLGLLAGIIFGLIMGTVIFYRSNELGWALESGAVSGGVFGLFWGVLTHIGRMKRLDVAQSESTTGDQP